MDGIYNITFSGNTIGKAIVKTCGLYYNIECICNLPDDGIHRVKLRADALVIPLGVYVPSGKKAGLKKRIPVKYFKSPHSVCFHIDEIDQTDAIQVLQCPDLCRLEDLRFRNGELYYSNS